MKPRTRARHIQKQPMGISRINVTTGTAGGGTGRAERLHLETDMPIIGQIDFSKPPPSTAEKIATNLAPVVAQKAFEYARATPTGQQIERGARRLFSQTDVPPTAPSFNAGLSDFSASRRSSLLSDYSESPFATPRSMDSDRSLAGSLNTSDTATFDTAGSIAPTESTMPLSNIGERRIIPSEVSNLSAAERRADYRYALEKARSIPNRINTPENEVALNRQIAERQIRGGADRFETERALNLRRPEISRTARIARGFQHRIEGQGNTIQESNIGRQIKAGARSRFRNYDAEGSDVSFGRFSATESRLSSVGSMSSRGTETNFFDDNFPSSLGGGEMNLGQLPRSSGLGRLAGEEDLGTGASAAAAEEAGAAEAGIGAAEAGIGAELGELGAAALL